MQYFVTKNSIVREIWGKSDTILSIFAGASAEFALNKAVDWLYYTGRLPKDPLGRLFSTVSYAREIVFAEKQAAVKAIDRINSIHGSVEAERGKSIPDWAYRDVLFMLIDYSIRSFEILERKLELSEKEEIFDVFWRVGKRMNLKGLPNNFKEFEIMRKNHLERNLEYASYTKDLYRQYRKHLGIARYSLLLETQTLICPAKVQKLLHLRRFSFLSVFIPIYKFSRDIKLDGILKSIILPAEYKTEIKSLDQLNTSTPST
ncbi:oxygenase MpaB family protein [Salegentibacter sp. Hel_I_6]|uniref:oxygenase MpaB family protein n=1 Tax=Salegentibacter sp. Hel_I_6 TaxID=1250278 RepID=UPI000564EBB4|nr:oxygenase MpaB family protein [Salegentibacter sp. Hel_I_6]